MFDHLHLFRRPAQNRATLGAADAIGQGRNRLGEHAVGTNEGDPRVRLGGHNGDGDRITRDVGDAGNGDGAGEGALMALADLPHHGEHP